VNLAEVLQHAHPYTKATGIDPITVLRASRIAIDSPGLDVARGVARLGSIDDASLADRFAIATAQILGARLHTTDTSLATIGRRLRVPVTIY
jgi:hypothetical protein